MDTPRKKHFEELEDKIESLFIKKAKDFKTLKEQEKFLNTYNEAKDYLWQLEDLESVYSAYKKMDKLCELYLKKDKEYDKAKGKRLLYTFVGFTIAYFIFFTIGIKPTDIGILFVVLLSLFAAAIHVGVNDTIFAWLHSEARKENNHLDSLKKEIDLVREKISTREYPTKEAISNISQRLQSKIEQLESFK